MVCDLTSYETPVSLFRVVTVVCFLCRYVIVECEDQDTQQRDPKTHEMYLSVMRRFSQALLKVHTYDTHIHIQIDKTCTYTHTHTLVKHILTLTSTNTLILITNNTEKG